MEFWYSARFSLWKVRPPGLGASAAARSMFASRVSTSIRRVSPPGRGMPGGGIISARNFWIIFSAVSGALEAAATSKPISERLPVWRKSLWQTWQ